MAGFAAQGFIECERGKAAGATAGESGATLRVLVLLGASREEENWKKLNPVVL